VDENGIADDRIFALLYHEIRAVARRHVAWERPGHTLNATALVHELYVRLAGSDKGFTSESEFISTASLMMRRMLVDYARSRNREKRGGGKETIRLEDLYFDVAENQPIGVEDLDEALTCLAEISERQARIVELRFFGGLNVEQTAAELQISSKTVKRDWATAKTWLRKWLDRRGGAP
jgi:RNA polymerase sigma-70 factor (ECF subfamily)